MSDEKITVLYLGGQDFGYRRVERDSTAENIRKAVEGEMFDRIHIADGVDFWVSDFGSYTHPIYELPSAVLATLMGDMVDGEYPAHEDDRDQVRELLASNTWQPVIFGPCLVTGVNAAGDTVSLPEQFKEWFDQLALRILDEGIPPNLLADMMRKLGR